MRAGTSATTQRRNGIRAASVSALLVASLLCTETALAADAARARFDLDDVARLADVAEPAISPDGEFVAYTVTTVNATEDEPQSDVWRVRWDGSNRQALTQTPDSSEWRPSFSPDGRWLAFLADRGGDDATTQIWIMSTTGGEARKLTDFAGGVTDFDWSPDSRRLAVIATDPERPPGAEKPKNPPPIVIDRYYLKEDTSDYLTSRRQHLYLFDVESAAVTPLTKGANDEWLPAWSPDGATIVFVTKRGDDADRGSNFDLYTIAAHAGTTERRLTSFEGADPDPYWDVRPSWSPDGRQIAYLQGGEDKWIYYSAPQLAVVDVASARSRLVAPIDRWFYKVAFAPDGRSVLALIEQSRVMNLSRVDLRSGRITPLTTGLRYDADFAVAPNGRTVVLGGDDLHPYEVSAVGKNGLRQLSDQNAFLRTMELGKVEPIEFRSADGTTIEGLLVKPVGYVPGRRYPTVLNLHGGPVSQFNHEFDYEHQVFASHGYAVIAPNPRGSSGRGFEFAKAIYADWGNKDVADVLAAVDHVVSLGVADPDRLAVGGLSYGAILTNYVIASTARFKAATSSAGSSEFLGLYGHDMYVREYEAELGPPWKNPDLYLKLSYPFLHADRVRTPTSFYCGDKDFNVPCHGSEQMYQALRSLGVPTQLVVYPGQNHILTVPSYIRDRLGRYLEWYDRYLQPGAAQGGR
jgi:dipeptidyl aminopeptidase/acylaminoacyl peptidase